MNALLLIAAMLAAPVEVGPEETYGRRLTLSGAASTRDFTITNTGGKYSFANLEVVRVRSAGTDLTMTCVSTTRTSTTPTAARTICTYDASGVCASATAQLKSATSASETLAWRVDVAGWERTDCTLASTSAGAGDLATVTGRKVTQ